MGESDVRRARDVQAVLADGGQFSVPWAGLLVAAVAERHKVTLLHGSRCLDLVARTTGQAVEWVPPPSAETFPSHPTQGGV
jgi:hypothetical protein